MTSPNLAASCLRGPKASSTALRLIPIMSISSAKPRSMCDFVMMVPLLCTPALRIAPSNAMLNNKFDSPSPCFKPSNVTKGSDISPVILTLDVKPSRVARISLISFVGKPCSGMIRHNSFLLTESYAALKSMNRWCVCKLNSRNFIEDLSQGKHLVRRGASPSKTALILANKGLLQRPQSVEQDAGENFVHGVEKSYAPIIATVQTMTFFVDRAYETLQPVRGQFFIRPHSQYDPMDGTIQLFAPDFEEFGGNAALPSCLAVSQLFHCFLHLVHGWWIHSLTIILNSHPAPFDSTVSLTVQQHTEVFLPTPGHLCSIGYQVPLPIVAHDRS
ncbi:uncharacterized protein LOC129721957 [Wyeomyia smithii]|uniref:uncharacterized protein LOC129721957 n=1 Tax=Wyeomyia smithii TaxID=174621 RepID=UPI002467DFAD|nr:uncharacterized protein LOC129721957 [Wyeomyia smithii]